MRTKSISLSLHSYFLISKQLQIAYNLYGAYLKNKANRMFKKGSKINSILTGSCPRCQNESMYVDKNPLHLSKVLKMNENCSHCGLKYHLEPSFFYGAMYVSYGLNVGIGIAAFIVSFIFFETTIEQSFLAIIITLIVLFPFVLRLARNLYINMFVSYAPKTGQK